MLSNLFLDLDGTLIDSSSGIYHSFCLACRYASVKPPSLNEFCSYIGPPIQNIARRMYPDLDQKALEDFKNIFREDYDQASYRMASWYPDVIDTLHYLSADLGINLIIVTNKPSKPAINLVKEGGLLNIFSRVVGIDYRVMKNTGPIFNSKTEALSYVLNSDDFDLSRSAYLGDTLSDRDACQACDLLFVGALYGYHEWTPEQRPYWHLKRFGDIKLLLKNLEKLS